MAVERILEFVVIYAPNFDYLVVTSTDKELAVARELNSSDWRTVGFERDRTTFNSVIPNSNCFIFSTRSY